MTYIATTDYFFEVSSGRVPGKSAFSWAMRNPSLAVSNVYEDCWHAGGNMVYPIAGETWEVLSDNPNDTAAGSGARAALVTYLDTNYEVQTQSVTLDGTTPVSLAGSDQFRPQSIVLTGAGASETNEGTITVRDSATPANIRNEIEIGFSISKDGHFTIPAGKTGRLKLTFPSFQRNESGGIRGLIRSSGANQPWILGAIGEFYQTSFAIPTILPGPFPERSDIRFQVNSFNAGAAVTLFAELVLEDN